RAQFCRLRSAQAGDNGAFQLSFELQTLLQALQIKQQVLNVLIAFISVLAQGLRNDALQLRRDLPRVTSQRRRLFVAGNGRQDSFAFTPSNGRRPATISYSTAPRLKMSVRASTCRPRACSGDM